MKRMLIGIAAVTSLLATSAFAADLPMRTYTKAPAYVEPVYNWTGFYIGGNVGYSWGRSSTTEAFSDALTGTVLNAATYGTDEESFIMVHSAGSSTGCTTVRIEPSALTTSERSTRTNAVKRVSNEASAPFHP